MEKFKEPDHWYRYDGLHINLSKLTDEELARFSQHHEARDNALHEAGRCIAREYSSRTQNVHEVLQFFGMQDTEVVTDGEL